MRKRKILVVDDDSTMRGYLGEVLRRQNYYVDMAEDGKKAIFKIQNNDYNLIITDIRMPEVSGMEVLKKAKEIKPSSEVIMITAYGSISNAVEAIKLGAFDYLEKTHSAGGISPDEVEIKVKKVFDMQDLKEENTRLKNIIDTKYRFDNIIGKSDSMQKIFDTLRDVADSSATIFIQGPSGTGKELIAKALHYNSSRKDKPFIKTNCAALPEGLMESELFGHEKGAFTGAVRTRMGRFEAANGGTLLLDEISEMSSGLQAKLLRVLQEKEFEKVGDVESIKVDVRIIATTNRDIKEEIKKGNFREDLYYRLNVIPIYIPPLKERKSDITLLVKHFIEKYKTEHNKECTGISNESLNFLLSLDYPGNVRELENLVERAVILSKNPELQISDFNLEPDEEMKKLHDAAPLRENISIREAEKELIVRTLKKTNFNRTKAADILKISVRTLRNKLNEYKENQEIEESFFTEL